MSERIKRLKERQNQAKPCISAERARLATEAIERYAAEPPVLQKAYTTAHILKNMTICIEQDELLVGNQADKMRCAPIFPEYYSQWVLDEIDDFPTRPNDPLQVTEEDKKELIEILTKWKGKSFNDKVEELMPENILEAERAGLITVNARDCATGHVLPDYWTILKKGLGWYRERCRKKIKEQSVCGEQDVDKIDFWKAVIVVVDGAEAFGKRYSKLALELAEKEEDVQRKKELELIAHTCSRIPTEPAETFPEAIQMVWFIHLIINIESNGHGHSFHRFDQYLNRFYIEDKKAGRITDDQVIEYIACFFIKATEIMKVRNRETSAGYAGYPVWQNLIVGGQNPDGSDASNELSILTLKANRLVQTSQPTASVRYHDGISKELMDEALGMIQDGLATPAFFNDKLVVPMVMEKYGVSEEIARNWGLMACVEPIIPGYVDGRPTTGYVNSLKCLELVLHNGVDPLTGKKIGVETGEIHTLDTLEKLQNALYTQIDYFTELMTRGFTLVGAMHADRMPLAFASLTINDCVEKGMSIQSGGARYSGSEAFLTGVGNTSDSLAAIDMIIFKKKYYTMDELLDALSVNFEGHEEMRLTLLNKAPKYGNDIDYVDAIASDLVKNYAKMLGKHKDSRGGDYHEVVESQSFNVAQGKHVQATPDGRYAYEPTNDNCSPVMGRDTTGPTACVKSVAKLDQKNAKGGCLFNMRFEPRSVAGAKGRKIMGDVVKTFFDDYGEHIQINVVDNETLKAAKREPEKYRNLLVRVAGYMAYFTELDEEVQDNIIARTAHNPTEGAAC